MRLVKSYPDVDVVCYEKGETVPKGEYLHLDNERSAYEYASNGQDYLRSSGYIKMRPALKCGNYPYWVIVPLAPVNEFGEIAP